MAESDTPRLVGEMIELLESLGYEVTKKEQLESQNDVYYRQDSRYVYNPYHIMSLRNPTPYETMGTGIEYLDHMIDG